MSIYDNAGVVLIPSGYKAGTTDNLYSVLPANGNGDFNATRGSTATRVNKDGLIEGVATNVPRLDYPLINGVVQDCPALLLEPSRGNSAEYSEDFTNWVSTAVTVTANQGISPDGSQTADSAATNNANGVVADGFSVSNDSSTRTLSVFVKYVSGTSDFMLRGAYTGGSSVAKRTKFDISTGSIITTDTTASIQNYGNGWYRLSQQITNNSLGNTNLAFQLFTTNDTVLTNEWLIWGAQLETSSYVTSYIPNLSTGSTTRSADVCNGSGTSAEFNDSEGVLFAEISALANDSTFRFITISDGTTSNRVTIFFRDDNTLDGGVEGATFFDSSVDILDFNRVAVKYKSGDSSFFVNGFKVDSNTDTFTNTGLNQLDFDLSNGSLPFYGKTKQLMTFKTALTDSDLETLTSWDSFNAMATGQLYTIE